MICQYCKQRYADFPDEDFTVLPGKGIAAKSNESHERRMKVYWNNEIGDCGCDEQ